MAAVALKMTCNNPKNLFCFVCGIYTKSHHKRSIMTKPLIDAYEAYFQRRTTKRNYVHGPSSVCNDCNNALLRWANGLVLRPELAFDVPMIWSEPRNHQTDCYFCLTRSVLPTRRGAGYINDAVEYPNDLNSAIKPRLKGSRAAVPGMGMVSGLYRRGRSMGAIVNGSTASVQQPHVICTIDGKPVVMKAESAQPHDSRVRVVRQMGPVLIAGKKRKPSVEPASANTYDVKKVRLRSSEPSIVLEQSQKRLPVNSVGTAAPSASVQMFQPVTPTVTNTPNQPTITRVFSLQGEIPAYDDLSSSPTELMRAINGHIEMPVTIEIDDDDDDEEEVKVKEQMQDEAEEEEDETITKQEQQDEEHETDASQQEQEPAEDLQEEETLEDGNELHQRQQPVEEDRKPPMAPAAEFINIHSLPSASSTASSKMVVVKMASPRKPNVAPSSSSSGGTAMTSTATTSAPTANVTQLFPVPLGRSPHLITQSELILLLRDLELTREKSAILIDRLKRWNLLAAQLVKPSRERSSVGVPAAEPPRPAALPLVRRVSTMAGLSAMGSVTIKQGTRTPVVLTTQTGVQPNGRQSFIRLTSAAVQSNTVTTSNNNGKVTVANGVPVLRQQLQTVRTVGNRSPAKLKVISPNKLVARRVEQLQPITPATTNGNSCARLEPTEV